MSASSSSIRNSLWFHCCRLRKTSFSATRRPRFGVIDWDKAFARTRDLLKTSSGSTKIPKTLITNIGVGKQQLVEIAKALSKKVKLLILDEPTASAERDRIATRFSLCCSISRPAGHLVDPDLPQAERNLEGGRPDHHPARRHDGRNSQLSQRFRDQRRSHHPGDGGARYGASAIRPGPRRSARPLLEVKQLERPSPSCMPIALVVKQHQLHRAASGEIVGIAGLMGSGRTELAMSIFGRAYGQKHLAATVRIERQGLPTSRPSTRRSRPASPMSRKTANNSVSYSTRTSPRTRRWPICLASRPRW